MGNRSIVAYYLFVGSVLGYANGTHFNSGIKGMFIGAAVGGIISIFAIISLNNEKE
jgi:hypothetical protein